jgi:PAS domain S-box-containing protein
MGARSDHAMAQSMIRDSAALPASPEQNRVWSIGSATASLTGAIVSLVALGIYRAEVGHGTLILAGGLLFLIAAFHVRFLRFAREQYRRSRDRALNKDREFRAIFENALDAIIVIDSNGVCQSANPSSGELFGTRREAMVGKPVGLFFSGSHNFDSTLKLLLGSQIQHGEAEFLRADGATVFVEFTAAAHFLPNRHLLILRDITQRRRSQKVANQSLVLARASWLQADAIREATLALTEDLRMDRVLDTLLGTLARFVPYERAQLLLIEADSRLFLAREAPQGTEFPLGLGFPETLELSEFPLLVRAVQHRDGLMVSDARLQEDWRLPGEESLVRSWMGVPIISSSRVLGVLSISHSIPTQFFPNHLRLAQSLATSAAVAIQNARLYERAEIYGSELEHRISELHRVERTLQESEHQRRTSEGRFQSVFRAIPVAIFVTTLAEGRFVDVNETFERQFSLARKDLLGRTSTELGIWENPQERIDLIEQLRGGTIVREGVARLKAKSGLYQPALYSAEMIDLDSLPCLLIAIRDFPHFPSGPCN